MFKVHASGHQLLQSGNAGQLQHLLSSLLRQVTYSSQFFCLIIIHALWSMIAETPRRILTIGRNACTITSVLRGWLDGSSATL